MAWPVPARLRPACRPGRPSPGPWRLPGWLRSCEPPALARLVALAQGLERLADAVLRGRGVVGHELHLQARRGQLDHVRGLVAAAADVGGHVGDDGGLRIQGLAPGARHGFVPAAAVTGGRSTADATGPAGCGCAGDELAQAGGSCCDIGHGPLLVSLCDYVRSGLTSL